MPAVEGHRDGAFFQQRLEADQLPPFVGQDEIRHRLAGLRRILADIVLLQPRNEMIDGILKLGTQPSHRIGEGLQPLGLRAVHVAALDEGLFELL